MSCFFLWGLCSGRKFFLLIPGDVSAKFIRQWPLGSETFRYYDKRRLLAGCHKTDVQMWCFQMPQLNLTAWDHSAWWTATTNICRQQWLLTVTVKIKLHAKNWVTCIHESAFTSCANAQQAVKGLVYSLIKQKKITWIKKKSHQLKNINMREEQELKYILNQAALNLHSMLMTSTCFFLLRSIPKFKRLLISF